MISPKILHRWLALGVILPGLVLLLSGAGLSFAKEIDRFMQPSLLSVAASGEIELATMHSIIAVQLLAQPQWTLRQVRYPRSPYDPITLSIQVDDASTLVYLNPHSGKLLGQRPQATELAERLRRLHVELISPSLGPLLAVLVGVVLVLMIGLGVYLSRVEGHWRLHSWHARLGLLIAPILLVIVGSGLFSVYGPDHLGLAAETLDPSNQADRVPLSFFAWPASQFPSACRQQLVSLTAVNGSLSMRCDHGVVFSLSSNDSIQDVQMVRDVGRVLWNLHSGEWAGLPGRGIWMWSVLAVLYLLYSGIRDWRHRTNNRK